MGKKRVNTIYEVYKNDEFVCKGTQVEVQRVLHTNACIGSYACRGYKLFGEYEIRKADLKAPKLSKFDKELNYLVEGLKRERNVYFNKDPKDYLVELKKLGFEVNVIVYKLKNRKDYVLEKV